MQSKVVWYQMLISGHEVLYLYCDPSIEGGWYS